MTNTSYRIIIVDDDSFISDMYLLKFRTAGHQVTVVSSAEEAKNRFQSGEQFDILLLDLVMPGVNGFEFLEDANEAEILGDTTVIVLTNQSREEDVKKAESLGAKGYIVKASSVPSEVVAYVLEIMGSDSENIILKH